MSNGPASNAKWLYDSPINSDVEAKLRRFLVELGNADRILGIQVCAYKGGKVIIDTSAGVLGIDDPRPVQPDSLFNVFSVTKGITAGMILWLADKGFFSTNGSLIGFGHMGLGGATGYCDINNRFAIGVTLNKCSFGGLNGEIIWFICSELDLPLSQEYAVSS